MTHVCHSITCLFDLPDEILLLICRYLSIHHILYSFYTPSQSEQRLHRMAFDYYKKIKLDGMKNDEYNYISKLFSDSEIPLRPISLILSNEHVTCLIYYYFTSISENVIQSIFDNLKHLTLIDCSENNLQYLNKYIRNLTQLQYLHITMRKLVRNEDIDSFQACNNTLFNQLLFNEKISSIHTVYYQIHNGLVLNKSLISHHHLRNVNLVLQTIDDFYILLDGLVPNIQTMIIKLFQSSRRSGHHRPNARQICPRLTDLTLFESSTEFVIDDLKSIFTYMTNLINLTLSIHDTFDQLFCHGPTLESILNEYLPHLHQFHYTMTQQIVNRILIKDFVRWPMNVTFYGEWIHIYSLPWPSNKNDKRQLPIIRNGSKSSVSSDVKTSKYIKQMIITKDDKFNLLNTKSNHISEIISRILINIKLPFRINKFTFLSETPIFEINSIIQPSVHHLIVQRFLYDEREMLALAYQFPRVKYLELLLPLEKCAFVNCLNILFNQDDNNNNIEKISSYWSDLIFFSTELLYTHRDIISNESHSFIRNINLKCHQNFFHELYSTLTIWY